MNRLARSKYGPPKFRKVFESMDTDQSGLIDAAEFVAALGGMGFQLDQDTVATSGYARGSRPFYVSCNALLCAVLRDFCSYFVQKCDQSAHNIVFFKT